MQARGCHITYVLAAESDAPMVRPCKQFLYDFILRSRISGSMNPAFKPPCKGATVDGKWSTVLGSYNLNHVSAYASIEINVGILDESFAQDLKNLHEIIKMTAAGHL